MLDDFIYEHPGWSLAVGYTGLLMVLALLAVGLYTVAMAAGGEGAQEGLRTVTTASGAVFECVAK